MGKMKDFMLTVEHAIELYSKYVETSMNMDEISITDERSFIINHVRGEYPKLHNKVFSVLIEQTLGEINKKRQTDISKYHGLSPIDIREKLFDMVEKDLGWKFIHRTDLMELFSMTPKIVKWTPTKNRVYGKYKWNVCISFGPSQNERTRSTVFYQHTFDSLYKVTADEETIRSYFGWYHTMRHMDMQKKTIRALHEHIEDIIGDESKDYLWRIKRFSEEHAKDNNIDIKVTTTDSPYYNKVNGGRCYFYFNDPEFYKFLTENFGDFIESVTRPISEEHDRLLDENMNLVFRHVPWKEKYHFKIEAKKCSSPMKNWINEYFDKRTDGYIYEEGYKDWRKGKNDILYLEDRLDVLALKLEYAEDIKRIYVYQNVVELADTEPEE